MTEMLCTKCSDPLKPVVAVDIDGTLGDFHTHFLRFLEVYLGLDNLPNSLTRTPTEQYAPLHLYTGDRPMHEWAQEAYGITYRTWQDIKLAYRQGAQKRSMPIFDGAEELMRRLRQAGAEVWMTTTRPYLRLDNVDPDTRFWLARHNIEYEYMLYDEDKYVKLFERVGHRVVGVLDDLPEQIMAAREIWGEGAVVQRKTVWNSAYHDWPWEQVRDLYLAADILVDRVQRYTSLPYETLRRGNP